MSQDSFSNYRALLAKVDGFYDQVAAAHPLRCARGCSACCYTRLSVSRVEAEHIRAHLANRRSAGRMQPGKSVAAHRRDSVGSDNAESAAPAEVATGGWSAARATRGPHDDHSLFEQLAGPEPCAFLGSGGDCSIYEARPLICRSHGIPVRVEGRIDVCPLNSEIEGAPALSLEVVNTTLAAIDALYCRETGLSPTRVALSDLADEAASNTGATSGRGR